MEERLARARAAAPFCARPPGMESTEVLPLVDWEAIYQRQVARADLAAEWLEALHLAPGHRVLDVGAGTGYVTLRLAEQVGPLGQVYALDRAEAALAFLAERQQARGITHITRIIADAADMEGHSLRGDAALITLLLHIVADPKAVIATVSRGLVPGGRLVVAEFHPDGPCETGAPREKRIAPTEVERWCRETGLEVVETRRQASEYYMLVAQRRPSS